MPDLAISTLIPLDQVDPAGALPGRLLRRGRASEPGRLAAE